MASAVRHPWRLAGAIVVSALSLQLYFAGRIALMKQGRILALEKTADLLAAHEGASLESIFVKVMQQ